MSDNTSTPAPDVEQRLAELVRTLRATEQELRLLTGGQETQAEESLQHSQTLLRIATAEAETRELAERLTTTLESLTDGFFTIDRDWRFTYVNREAERMFGLPRAELLGHHIWAKFPEARGTISHQEYERAMRDNVAVQFETFYPPLGIWFDARAFPSTQGLAVYFRDITAVRQAGEALRTSEERFRLLAKATNDAIWDWDLVTNALWWNEGFEKLFGYRREDVDPTVKSWTDCIHPEDLTRVTDGIHHVIEHGGEGWTDEYRFRCQDGSYAYVLDRGHIIRDGAGKAVRMIGGMTDLTERKRAEEALRESEERFAGAFEHAPIGVALVSPDGRWLKVNRALCDLVGYSEAELLTRTFQDITHPEDLELDLENVRRMIAGDILSYQMEKRYVHARGHLVTVLLNVSLVRDGQDQPRYFISQIQDITSRKEADAGAQADGECLAREQREIPPAGGQHHRRLLDPLAGHARGALRQSGLRADLGPFRGKPVRQSAAVGRLHPAGGPRACAGRLRRAHGRRTKPGHRVSHRAARRRDPLDSCPRFSGPGCRRQADPPHRDCHRHHRAAARGGSLANEPGGNLPHQPGPPGGDRGEETRGGCGRSRQPREERVPGQHEPRDSHADERRHRHDRARARHGPHRRAARVSGHGQVVRRVAADRHQRHSRLLEDRGRTSSPSTSSRST